MVQCSQANHSGESNGRIVYNSSDDNAHGDNICNNDGVYRAYGTYNRTHGDACRYIDDGDSNDGNVYNSGKGDDIYNSNVDDIHAHCNDSSRPTYSGDSGVRLRKKDIVDVKL